MACMKCGSDWITATGKDCVSCPHCCKQQRCKARKQGRFAGRANVKCKHCGREFEPSSNGQQCCSVACRQAARKVWLAKWRSDYNKNYRAGRLRGTQDRKRKVVACAMCGGKLKKNQEKYCSRKCFADAKKCGIQAWDRTNQLESVFHRGGRWNNSPSKRHAKAVRRLDEWLRKAAGLCDQMLKLNAIPVKECDQCGKPCKGAAERFCSYECMGAWRGPRPCRCGRIVLDSSAHGSPSCDVCKRESRRQHRRMYGSYRKRCRTYGGYFNAVVKPRDVFSRDKWRCHVCGKKTSMVFSNHDPRSATVDHHPTPLSKGGDHDWHNVRCACFACNTVKGNKWDGQRRLALRS
jgi:hypothetical protein